MRYAIIERGNVVAVALWGGVTEWSVDEGQSAIDCPDSVGPGWTHDDEGFHAPPEPVVEDPA